MNDIEKLLPCPFCGGSAVLNIEEHTFYSANIRCDVCSAVTGECAEQDDLNTNIKEAINLWNKRI